MMKTLLDGLSIWVEVKFVLYQLHRKSMYANCLPCKDVPIFIEEFDECEFLFVIQTIPHMSNLGGLIRR
jgi:hypothetical protein